jgi:hypothetical protein
MIDAIKERLLAMRDEEIARVLRQNPSPTLAVITELLAALDEAPTEAEPASRAVVSDSGQEIRLTLYGETGAVATAELKPGNAIAVGSELINKGLLRLQ